jgi:hypothetical protein
MTLQAACEEQIVGSKRESREINQKEAILASRKEVNSGDFVGLWRW